MKQPLDEDEQAIIRTINENFRLTVSSLEFVPIGESAWLYKASDANGSLYSVKIQSDSNLAVDQTRKQLVEHGYRFAPKAYLDMASNIQAQFGELLISVEDYIEHSDIKSHDSLPSKEFLVKLGVALRDLHRIEIATGQPVVQPKETFESFYIQPAKAAIHTFLNWDKKAQVLALSASLEENKDAIERIFARSVVLGKELAQKQLPLILTHGDVHFGNTLEDRAGELYLIDWDATMIARPGHDLMYFDDSQVRQVAEGYGSDLLASQVELDYYRNHLMLRYMWFWINKIMKTTSQNEMTALADDFANIMHSDYLARALGE